MSHCSRNLFHLSLELCQNSALQMYLDKNLTNRRHIITANRSSVLRSCVRNSVSICCCTQWIRTIDLLFPAALPCRMRPNKQIYTNALSNQVIWCDWVIELKLSSTPRHLASATATYNPLHCLLLCGWYLGNGWWCCQTQRCLPLWCMYIPNALTQAHTHTQANTHSRRRCCLCR